MNWQGILDQLEAIAHKVVMRNDRHWKAWLGLFFGLATVGISFPALAQLTPDNTLGSEASRVNPGVDIGGQPGDRIEGGARRGVNLFHSFSDFNVNPGQRVYFANPTGVDNILTRVTGPSISNILGTLGVEGTANLFLLNPNGILFGPNAQLDIRGSFVASTAERMLFQDGAVFDTRDQTVSPLLTVNVPIGLQMGATPGAIRSRMRVVADINSNFADLALLGGDVILDNSVIIAPGRHVELGSAGSRSIVGLTITDNALKLNFPSGQQRQDVVFTNESGIDVSGMNGGSIAVNARNLNLAERSVLVAGIDSNSGTTTSQSGDISLNAIDTITIRQSSIIGNVVQTGATGNSGNVNIKTGSLTVLDGAQLISATFGIGNAGNVVIDAREHILFSGTSADGRYGSGAFSSVQEGAQGNGGNVQITTNTLEVRNGARLVAGILGTGDAGNIVINARERILFSDESLNSPFNITTSANAEEARGVSAPLNLERYRMYRSAFNPIQFNIGFAFSGIGKTGKGNGGDIKIDTNILEVRNGAQLLSATLGLGDAGNIIINAHDRALFSGTSNDGRFASSAFSSVQEGAEGNGGKIQITTNVLEVRDGARLIANTQGTGDAGDVMVDARDYALFTGRSADGRFGSAAFSSVSKGAQGEGGNVQIATNILEVLNGAQLTASTFSTGDAGNVLIEARDRILFSGTSTDGKRPSTAASSVEEGAQGKGGNVQVVTNILEVRDGAQLLANTWGTGNAGNVLIEAHDRVLFGGTSADGQHLSAAASSVEETGEGRGGNIQIDTKVLDVHEGARLVANTLGKGDAGNVMINARDAVKITGASSDGFSSAIYTYTATSGQGGNITVDTRAFEVSKGGVIDARTDPGASGNSGNIAINAATVDLLNGGQLLAVTQGSGRAGSITVNTADRLTIAGMDDTYATRLAQFGTRVAPVSESSGIYVLSQSTGGAGNITVTAPTLNVTDRAEISASTTGAGAAGSIRIQTDDTTLTQGGRISSNTSSSRAAGDVILNVTNTLRLTGAGSGIFASTTPGSTGNGGNITIAPQTLLVQDRATIAVNSQGQGQGGTISVQAGRVELRDRGSITAETASTQGGNITLNVQDLLLLRRNSLISTTAGTAQAGGNGGNIKISAPFVIGVLSENSDIRANAFTGQGGRVDITAQGIFGLKFQPRDTPRSDITASSEFGISGQVVLNTPGIDPSQGLTELPGDLTDPSNQINQVCANRNSANENANEFVVTGRGGLPPNPTTPLTGDELMAGWVSMPREAAPNPATVASQPAPPPAIVEAQGWVVDAAGNVTLVAHTETGLTRLNSVIPQNCR